MKAEQTEANRVQVAVYKPKADRIQRIIADYFGIPIHDIQKHTRKGSSLTARRYAHYFCKKLMPACSLHVIGILTGNGRPYDHATIHHSIKKINEGLSLTNRNGQLIYPDVLHDVNGLKRKLKNINDLHDEIVKANARRIIYHFRNIYRKSRKYEITKQTSTKLV